MIDRTSHAYLSNFVSLSNMQDSLQKHIEKLKIMKESAKRRNELYSDLTKLDDKNTRRSLRALTKAPAPGKKIQKIGFIMCWIPEPTGITCAVGGPMILAGNTLRKFTTAQRYQMLVTIPKTLFLPFMISKIL